MYKKEHFWTSAQYFKEFHLKYFHRELNLKSNLDVVKFLTGFF